MYMVSGRGKFAGGMGGADAVATEMKSGTILAGVARPVKRWEFLLGKYLGVLMAHGVLRGDDVRIELPAGVDGRATGADGSWMLLAYPSCGTRFIGDRDGVETLVHPVLSWHSLCCWSCGDAGGSV